MAISINNYLIENEKSKDNDNYFIDNDQNYTFTSFSTVKLFEYVMNSKESTPFKTPQRPQRCPSNVSEISGISTFSIQQKTAAKNLYSDYHVGDYVYVDSISGVKYGVIRYAGYVDFAKGYWFGIELSEPLGKNNGSIRGKSYFTCPENHGIFTQSSKISKSPPIKKTHRLTSATGSIFGSKESLNSSVYLKKNGLNTSQESLRSCVSGVSNITGVFKQPSTRNLKNQLIKSNLDSPSPSKISGDRVDITKSELTYLSVQESEQLVKSKIELSNQKRELEEQVKQFENEISELRNLINEERKAKEELFNQFEKEKKKIEILEFKFEEEKISKLQLDEEMTKKEKIIAELRRKSEDVINLKNDEKEIEMFELQEDVIKKEEKILQLESSLKTKQNENQNLLERTREFEQTIKVYEQRQENFLTKIDDLNLKIKKYELEKAQLEDAISSNKQENKSSFNSITNELETKSKELNELKDELMKKTNEITILKDELNRMNNKFNNLEDVKLKLEKEFEKMKTDLTNQIEKLEDNKLIINERLNKNELEQNEERKKLNEQIENYKIQLNELKSKLEEFKNSEQFNQINLQTKDENVIKLEIELKDSKKEIENLKINLTNLTTSQKSKDTEIQKLKIESERLIDKIEQNEIEKQKLENEIDQLKSNLEDKENDLNNFNKNKLKFRDEMEKLMRDLESERNKNRELLTDKNQLNESQNTKLSSAYKELNLIKNAHSQVSIQLEEQIEIVTNLQSKYNQLDIKAKQLEKTNQELKLMITKTENTKDKELNSIRDEHSKEINEIEIKLNNYENNLKKLHDSLVDKDLELNSLQLEHQQEIEQLRLDSQLKCSELEKCIIELKCELETNKKEFNEFKVNRLNQEEQLNNDDKDLYESQIKFLNSVIVDMQGQNDQLKSKVKMLEEIRLEEMNSFKLNSSDDQNNKLNNNDDDQFSFRPVVNKNVTSYSFNNTQRTTRLFCYHCDQFDMHDSEDCLKHLAEKQEIEQQHHARLGKSKKQTRAYCVNCEIFDSHWTFDCEKSKN